MNDESFDLTALLGGDAAAWQAFVQRYARVIYAAVQRSLVSAGYTQDVQDVAQDVFVKLCRDDFRLLKTYDSERARLTTWLTMISTTTSIDHLRRQKLQTTDIDAVPERVLAVEDKLPEAIKIPPGLLSPRQALVLELLYRKDLEVADAAEIMKINPQTVRSMHHKALVKLRKHFAAQELGENGDGEAPKAVSQGSKERSP